METQRQPGTQRHGRTRGWKQSEGKVEKMAQKINQEKPMFVIGGMSGNSFSKLRNLQRLSEGDDEKDKAYLQSVIQHYLTQIEEGRIFLHVDTVGSADWRTTAMQDLRRTPGVKTVEIDLCMFAGNKNVPSKGPMRFVTNSQVLERDLTKADLRLQTPGTHWSVRAEQAQDEMRPPT